MIEKKRKDLAENILIGLILVIISVIVCMQSPINIFLPRGKEYTDSSVFHYVARAMDVGKLPYRDVFDHKGIILYFINWLGFKISDYNGIWYIEVAFMFFSVWGAYKLARLVTTKIKSLFAVLVVFSLLFYFFSGGNHAEEYALPIQIWSLYVFTDYFLNDRTSNLRIMFCGAGFAAICFLRINIMPEWISFCICIFIVLLVKKETKQLLKYMVAFILGFLIITLPVCSYLVINGIFDDFIDDYFVFNFAYINSSYDVSDAALLNVAVALLSYQAVWISILLSVVFMIFPRKRGNRLFETVYSFYIVVDILLACISGRQYCHYGISIMPMMIYLYASLFDRAKRVEMRDFSVKKINWFFIASIYVVIVLNIPWVEMTRICNSYIRAFAADDYQYEEQYWDTNEYIESVTTEDDLITVVGNQAGIYNNSGRLSASKYIYQTRADIKPEILDGYYYELDENEVKLIVMCSEPDDRMKKFMNEHDFVKTQTFGEYEIYEIKNEV